MGGVSVLTINIDILIITLDFLCFFFIDYQPYHHTFLLIVGKNPRNMPVFVGYLLVEVFLLTMDCIIYLALFLISTVSCELPLPSSAEGDPEMVKYLESMWNGYWKA